MEGPIKQYWLLEFIILVGIISSVIKADHGPATSCACAPTWGEYWDRYTPNLSLLTSTQRMVFLVDSDVESTIADTLLVAVPPTLISKFISKIPNLKTFAANSKFYVEMLEHKYRRLTEQGHSCILEADTKSEIQLAEAIIKEATDGVTNLVSDWNVSKIIAYNSLVQKQLLESANYFKLKQMNTTVNYPQNNLTLFADWYLPIYEKHGGNKTIQRFVDVINTRYSKINKSGLVTDKVIISPGEFVHIWSQAANTDLRDLAYKAFGWTPEYRSQFETSRKTSALYNYSDVYPNASLYKPPHTWIIQGTNLILVYSDDHVAFYYDESVPHNVTWPFKIASDAWSYVKSAYSYSGPDPILYVIFTNGNDPFTSCTFSRENSYLNKVYENRLVLDCKLVMHYWKRNKTQDIQDKLVQGVGKAAATVFKETGNNPWNIMDTDFAEIFTYDIYLGTGNIREASRYVADLQNWSFSGGNQVSWFLDWYYFIYNKYGGIYRGINTAVLKRFLTSLYQFWPRRGTDYTKQLRRGEFVHFWSGATGVDLTASAIKVFGMSPTDLAVLNQARVDYPMLNYTRETSETPRQTWFEHWSNHWDQLTLDYFDDHVAFYLDPSVNQSIAWLTSLMSDGWKYAKATYGTIGQSPLLYVVLHGNSKGYDRCLVSREQTFADRDFENQNVIDCGLLPDSENDRSTVEQVETLFIANLANLVRNSVKGVGNWPGRIISGPSFYTIITYDILGGIGRTETAKTWYTEKVLEYEKRWGIETFWFRDWYYPIYTNYGGSTAVNNFLDILSTHWPHENEDYLKQMNWGEWVHFWSAAVGENLLHLAYEFEQWNVLKYKEYLEARNKYHLKYSDVYQNSNVALPPETLIEDISYPVEGTKEILDLVYADANVAIYYDSSMERSITWPFKSLSAIWAYAKRNYGPIRPNPLLYVLFHNGRHVRDVETCWTYSYDDDSFYNRSVISCGHKNNPWNPPERLEQVIRGVATVILSTQNIEIIPEDIIVYDLYYSIGKKIEAREWRKRSISKDVNLKIMWNWLYPIYAKYGETHVLNNFFTLLHAHFPKNPSVLDFARSITEGEYVHFWSGATGDSLENWIKRTNLLTPEIEIELEKAIRDFPMVTYKANNETVNRELEAILVTEVEFGHTELIFQHYVDSNVNVYFDWDVDIAANWTFPFLSKSWQHAQSSYLTVGQSTSRILKTVLHANKYRGCQTLLILGRDSVNKTTTIDCGSVTSDNWSRMSQENKYDLINEYTNLIQKSANQTEDNTPYVRKEFSKLISFDLFMAQGMFKDAYEIISKGYNEAEVQSGANKFWVRDWFLPIYSKYGGVSVLSKFLALLPTHWNLRERNAGTTTMNVGQVVHFWSAAAGESVLNVAQDTFGRGSLHRDKLNEARKDFLLPHYSCYDCYYEGFEKSRSERNLITGLSLGFAGIVTAVVIISLYLYRRKVNRLKEQIRELTNEEINEFFEGNSNAESGDGNASIESKPFSKDYEISRDRLDISFDKVLGSGEFGIVLRGVLKLPSGEGVVVAVKTVKPDVDVTCFKALLMELKVMCHLGQHDNIASLLGAHTVNIRNREVYVVLEFCKKGDLLKFLKTNRSHFKNMFPRKHLQAPENNKSIDQCDVPGRSKNEDSSNYIVTDPSTIQDPASFSTLNLLEWSSQIANGMNYIASKKVIHGDLAARNVLLTLENVAKISDFGLSRQLLNYSNYLKTSKTPVPWRWMAIESLRDMNFSVKSDTWAFGVTLYEIFSLGTTPYAGWTYDHEFIGKLVAGHRLSEPEFGNEEIYSIMMDCMKIKPEDRITYEQLVLRFEALKNELMEEPEKDGNSSEN